MLERLSAGSLRFLMPSLGHAALCCLVFSATLAAAPSLVSEIRDLLRTGSLEIITQEVLAGIKEETLSEDLRRIDPYARLLPAKIGDAFTRSMGIGAELYSEAGRPWLLPYSGGPLADAGLEVRALLIAIEDENVEQWEEGRIAARIAAAGDQPVRLTLRSGKDTVDRQLLVQPAPFRPDSVEVVESEGEAVLRIRRFTAHETRSFLAATAAQYPSDQPLTLDLRDAPGGDLFEALDSAALFLPAGTLLATTSDRNNKRTPHLAPAGEKLAHPLVVKIGPFTASAAEIFAGILQSHQRASIVGEKSRGKCRSQTDTLLSDGRRLRYTNLRVELPDGRDCEGEGITP